MRSADGLYFIDMLMNPAWGCRRWNPGSSPASHPQRFLDLLHGNLAEVL